MFGGARKSKKSQQRRVVGYVNTQKMWREPKIGCGVCMAEAISGEIKNCVDQKPTEVVMFKEQPQWHYAVTCFAGTKI